MRIIVFTSWFFEYTIELSNALSEIDGNNVTLIMPDDIIEDYLGDFWDNLINKNINVKLFSYGNPLRVKNFIKYPLTLYSIVRFMHKIKPDVIHIQDSGNHFMIPILLFISKFPIISTNHDVKPHLGSDKGFKGRFREALRKILTSFSIKIIVHGNYLKTLAIKYLKLKSNDVLVIPHGEFSIFKKWNDDEIITEEPNTILFFGSISEYKGLEYLIKAEPTISKSIKNLNIIIAGYTDNFDKYKNLMVNQSKFECHIEYIPHSEIPILFQRSNIIVLPYIDASQSGIVPIAYAFKKPVVVTNVGCLPEVVDNGKTGFIVQSRDANALAEAIIKLLLDEKLRNKMSEYAYMKVKGELSWKMISEKTMEAYKEGINEYNKRKCY